ncbi:hypothetical protein [Pararhodonellum marinum]|uniref:hypothetical protein n=1 Tax=Pararhodonellum marinum TaxID=2755358 RepID=UPI00189001F9|nr:hypothetical protein [Pararhodonellum marinum]
MDFNVIRAQENKLLDCSDQPKHGRPDKKPIAKFSGQKLCWESETDKGRKNEIIADLNV